MERESLRVDSYDIYGVKPSRSGFAQVNGINLYYEIYGNGEPLLLIEGLGYSRWMWFKQVREFSSRHRVIVFDNRGVGKSDKPREEYTIELMASDAALLLDALGIDAAHVLGVSMGGFIAQQLAIDHPVRVLSLVLVSTAYAGGTYVYPNENPWGFFLKALEVFPGALELTAKMSGKGSGNVQFLLPLSTPEDSTRRALSYGFTKDYFATHLDEIDRIVAWRLAEPQPSYAWKNQFVAGLRFDASQRVGEISVPTLIVHGSEDGIVPPSNARALAEKIPLSRFVEIKGTGHLLFIEKSQEFNAIVLDFLSAVSAKEAAPPRRRPWWRRWFFRW
jgi:pimeloyl-ACP methyl ester carboxylesterase